LHHDKWPCRAGCQPALHRPQRPCVAGERVWTATAGIELSQGRGGARVRSPPRDLDPHPAGPIQIQLTRAAALAGFGRIYAVRSGGRRGSIDSSDPRGRGEAPSTYVIDAKGRNVYLRRSCSLSDYFTCGARPQGSFHWAQPAASIQPRSPAPPGRRGRSLGRREHPASNLAHLRRQAAGVDRG